MLGLLVALLEITAVQRFLRAHVLSSYIVGAVYWSSLVISGRFPAHFMILVFFAWSPLAIVIMLAISVFAIFHDKTLLALDPLVAPLYVVLVVGFLWNDARRHKQHAELQTRKKTGQCLACGYDLTGNSSGICPECGKPVPEKLSGDVWPIPSKHW